MRSSPSLSLAYIPISSFHHIYVYNKTQRPCLKVVNMLEKEGWGGAAGAKDVPSVRYRLFLALLWGVKEPKMAKRSISRRLWDFLVRRYVRAPNDVIRFPVCVRVRV